MRPLLVALAVASALAAGAACSGSSDARHARDEPDTFGDYLQTSPEACGLGRRGNVDLRRLRDASTVDEQVRALTDIVERLRRLERRRPIRPTFVSQRELRRRIERQAARSTPRRDLAEGQRVLALLGAVPRRGFDLRKAFINATAATLGGFYDPKTDELVVLRTRRGKLDLFDLELLAHELEHALVDQRFPLEDDYPIGWRDGPSSKLALVEGSATITEFRFLGAWSPRTLRRVLNDPQVLRGFASVPGLPHYLAAGFVYPYLEGVGFVCELYARGGWRAVNAAYRRPPRTSAEILFPARYRLRDRPAPPKPVQPPRGWSVRRIGGTFGAADLLWLFEAPGNHKQRALDRPLERAATWGGGRIDVFRRGQDVAAVISLREHPRGDGLCESVLAWYERAFPSAERMEQGEDVTFRGAGGAAVVVCAEKRVSVALARTLTAAQQLRAGVD